MIFPHFFNGAGRATGATNNGCLGRVAIAGAALILLAIFVVITFWQ